MSIVGDLEYHSIVVIILGGIVGFVKKHWAKLTLKI